MNTRRRCGDFWSVQILVSDPGRRVTGFRTARTAAVTGGVDRPKHGRAVALASHPGRQGLPTPPVAARPLALSVPPDLLPVLHRGGAEARRLPRLAAGSLANLAVPATLPQW